MEACPPSWEPGQIQSVKQVDGVVSQYIPEWFREVDVSQRETEHDRPDVQLVQQEGQDVACLVLSGRITYSNVDALRSQLLSELRSLPKGITLELDLRDVISSDAASAGLVTRLEHDASDLGLEWRLGKLDHTTKTMLELSKGHPGHDPSGDRKPVQPVEKFGEMVLEGAADFKVLIIYIGRVVSSLVWSLGHPGKIRWKEVAMLIQRTGAEALPIVALLSLLVGLVTAFSSAIQLRQFGANIFIADLVGIGMTREMGPLIAAILLTGRSGSAFAAEIGTMKISDEVDALTVMGVKPLNYLVMPRILAVMLTLPLLTLFADVAGILGGMIIGIASLDLTPLSFLQQFQKAVEVWDVFSGVLKAFFFGILIAGVGCYRGIETEGGALGVGRSTTSSVVSGIFLIVLADSLFVILFHYLGVG